MEESLFLFLGNAAWLDFVNTEQMRGGRRVDVLPDLSALLRWLAAVQLLPEEGVAVAQEDPERTMTATRSLRAALRSLADAVSQGESVPPAALIRINEILASHTGANQITPSESAVNGWQEIFTGRITLPEHLLVPLAQGAAQTLCYGDLSRVRRCKNDHCILRYYDTSKNGTRSWCSMGLCGNRAKAAAHYRRVHADL